VDGSLAQVCADYVRQHPGQSAGVAETVGSEEFGLTIFTPLLTR